MMASMELREGDAGDLDEMMVTMDEAFDAAFGEAWSRAQCLGILGLPGVWLTLARQDGEPVGFALNRVIFDEAELLLLGVRPAFRGHGIGRALLERSSAKARDLGARRLHLEVREGNHARLLYDAAGFVQIGSRRGYYRGKDGQLFNAATLACPLDGR
jgi:[ribosomal protein S18]-alanine N-acetyltransferase